MDDVEFSLLKILDGVVNLLLFIGVFDEICLELNRARAEVILEFPGPLGDLNVLDDTSPDSILLLKIDLDDKNLALPFAADDEVRDFSPVSGIFDDVRFEPPKLQLADARDSINILALTDVFL